MALYNFSSSSFFWSSVKISVKITVKIFSFKLLILVGMRFSTLWYLNNDLKIKALPDLSSSFLLFLLEPQNPENQLPLFFSSTFFFFFLNATAPLMQNLKWTPIFLQRCCCLMKRPSSSYWPLFPGQVGIWNIVFCLERKTGGPGEKPLE